MLRLVKPSKEYKESFLEAVEEFNDEGRFSELGNLKKGENFEDFLERIDKEEKGIDLKEGRVPQSVFWLVEDAQFLGRVCIRHTLNEKLLREGGHIGYSIRPSKRRMGYGSKILELGLLEAKKLGIDEVLLTCNEDNAGSKKIIEKNGGVYENKTSDTEDGKTKLRFWIQQR